MFSEPLVNAADEIITYEKTEMGPRVVGEDFETLVYPRKSGFQTTVAYWQRILSARHLEQYDVMATIQNDVTPEIRN